jgi:phospholipase D3/4
VKNIPSSGMPDNDTAQLAQMGVASVQSINWPELVGAGILHTKLMIIDDKNAYVGSCNADWRSLSQVKELGLVVSDCPTVAKDLKKIFEMYWEASNDVKLPPYWPSRFDTHYNMDNPMQLTVNGVPTSLFIASSPQEFCTTGRTGDIESLISVIHSAQQSISIEVMDYTSSSLYNNPNYYWPVISDALKSAAFERGVQVRLLVSKWPYSNNSKYYSITLITSISDMAISSRSQFYRKY